MATYSIAEVNGRLVVKGIGRDSLVNHAELSVKGSAQYIGRPAGPKAKGHKTPKTGNLPYMRHSVGDRLATEPTAGNKARAKHLRKIRNAKIRAAKTSVAI